MSQTLDECVWLLQMMEGADLAYPAMTEDEARHIEQDLIYAGARHTRKYRGGIHNIRCWHNSCWAAAGYFVGDPELVEFARDNKYGFVAQMERGALEDGMWYERSMGYHSYTVSAISYQLRASMHAGDDLYKMPQVRKLLTFPVMVTFPNLVPPSLNDGGFSTGPIGPNRLELAAAWQDDPVAIGAIRKRCEMGASRANMEAWQFGEAFPEGVEYTTPPSMDLKGAGLAVLRRGTGDGAICAMLEYGDHGGGHGHPDKLQLIFYALGDQRFPDLGTVGYANPLHPNYYKTTPAHNTVTIAGKNMAPAGGELLAFEDKERYAAAVVRSDQVYRGYTLFRRFLLADSFFVDKFIVDGDTPDTLDWFLRAKGDLTLDVATIPVAEKALSAPYTYLRNMEAVQTGDTWTATWSLSAPGEGDERPRLVLTMARVAETQVTQAQAPGAAKSGEYWPLLRVRRHAAGTRFLTVCQVVPAGAERCGVVFDVGTVRVGDEQVVLPPDDRLPPILKGDRPTGTRRD